MEPAPQHVAILGLGLMGGSLGLALKAGGFRGTVAAYARRPETLQLARRLGLADRLCPDPLEAVRDADLAVACVPVLAIPNLLAACRAGWKPGAVLTDVGSTKAEIQRRIRGLLDRAPVCYVGSHPVAGSEQQGLENARADLYRGATVVVTPAGDEPGGAVERVDALWKELGAVVYNMPPEEHDRVMARTSHLPHAVAALLAATVARDGEPERLGPFCGTGFRDTTRVAEGSPEVWRDIFESNRDHLAAELQAFAGQIRALADRLAARDGDGIQAVLDASRKQRRALLRGNGGAGTP